MNLSSKQQQLKRNLSQGSLQKGKRTRKFQTKVSESNPRAKTKSILKKRRFEDELEKPKKTIKISSQIRTFTEKDAKKEYRPRNRKKTEKSGKTQEIDQVKRHLKNHFRVFRKKKIEPKGKTYQVTKINSKTQTRKSKFVPEITNTETVFYVNKNAGEVSPAVTNVIRTIGLGHPQNGSGLGELGQLFSTENNQFSERIRKYFVSQNKGNATSNLKTGNSGINHQIRETIDKNTFVTSSKVKNMEIQNKTVNNVNSITNNSIQFYHPTQFIMIGQNHFYQSKSPSNKYRSYSMENSQINKVGMPGHRKRERNWAVESTNHHSSMVHFNQFPYRATSLMKEAHFDKSNSAGRFYHRRTRTVFSKDNRDRKMGPNKTETLPISRDQSAYLASELPSVNEVNWERKVSKSPALGLTKKVHLSSNLNDLLVLLFKKILVYSSKANSLKLKLSKENPEFNGDSILREIDSEQKGFLRLHDMAYCMHFFGFHLSDWDSFRLMSYLSGYRLATLEELIVQENISRAQELLVDPAKMENVDKGKKGVQNKQLMDLPQKSQKYSIDYAHFLRLVTSQNQRHLPTSTQSRRISEKTFHLVRQIILLTFRKIDEVAMIVRFLREEEFAHVLDRLSRLQEAKTQNFRFSGTFGTQKFNLIKGKSKQKKLNLKSEENCT